MKDQWIQELLRWKDKQDWKTFNQTHQEKKREDPNKIEIGKSRITTDTKAIQRLVRKYYEQPYYNKLDNWDELDKVLDKQSSKSKSGRIR